MNPLIDVKKRVVTPRYFTEGKAPKEPKDPEMEHNEPALPAPKVKREVKTEPKDREAPGRTFQNKKQNNAFNRKASLRPKHEKALKIPIDPAALMRHSRGESMNVGGVKSKFHQINEKRKDINIEFATQQAARAEILLHEEEGYLEADEGESTTNITQREIVDNVDITTATKHFNLTLDFGPYRTRYTKNGRYLLLGGKRGHVAAFDWVRKKLLCEMNVMESVHDVTWLMNQTMYAVAQKNWVHVYDHKGTEIHCIKTMHRSVRLEYLPYHFLLNSAGENGFLSWMDVSVGVSVGNYNTRMGKILAMAQNPWNAVTCVGGSKGVVSMWSPMVRDPLAKMLCHPVPLTGVAIDPQGIHMATAGLDRQVKIWDIRQLEGPLETYYINTAASELELSQRGLLALSMGNVCEVYRRDNSSTDDQMKPYIRHRTNGPISSIRFCPYEDILGVGTAKGFASLIVPGSGEPNFDTFEANPYQSRSQRREEEVHKLLEKIPAEFISLNPTQIDEVDVPSAKARLEQKVKLLTLKPPRIDFEPRKRNRVSKAKLVQIKRNVKEARFREAANELREIKEKLLAEEKTTEESPDFIPLEPKSVLDRFNTKKKKKATN
ncbi:WD repeat-containing protein 46 [Anopheles maculipalpis]|uniref:WD repeat-containing protein 46 n=1 Tax=Anopheles maculipalpis TaxID=1496333 RepID=UPI002158E16D|nr:WD repeat-containing protein 46 [Anopheles maculipalpis]